MIAAHALWWLASTGCGLAVGAVVGMILSDSFADIRWLAIALFALEGLVLGAVGGYIMAWVAPILPNWPARFIVAAVAGALVSAAAFPGSASYIAWTNAILGLIAALIATSIVHRFAHYP